MIQPIFHILLLRRSSAREVIEKDIIRWTQITDSARSEYPLLANFAWLVTDETLSEFRNLFYYRLGKPASLLDKLLLIAAKAVSKPRSALSIETPSVGPGFVIKHGFNAIIRAQSIGENCMVFQDVTIGYKNPGGGLPIIGDHVHISAGAKVLGPIKIGDYSVVAANSVITKDMPPHSTGGGVPARVIIRAGVIDDV